MRGAGGRYQMHLYSSGLADETQHNLCVSHRFGQRSPRWLCPRRHDDAFFTSLDRKGYQLKHRCPACSTQCFEAWAARQDAILARYIDQHLPANMVLYRGSLHMPKGATIQDHADARDRFLHALRLHRQRHGEDVQLRCQTHVTGPDQQHYDYVAYAPASMSPRRVGELLRSRWRAAGGRGRAACVTVERGREARRTVTYVVKRDERHRTRHYLPHPDCPLTYVWGTRGFYGPTSQNAIWQTLKVEWFGPPTTPVNSPDVADEALAGRVDASDATAPATAPVTADYAPAGETVGIPKAASTSAAHPVATDCEGMSAGATPIGQEDIRLSASPTAPTTAPDAPSPDALAASHDDVLAAIARDAKRRDDVDRRAIWACLGRTPADGVSLHLLAHRAGLEVRRCQTLMASVPGIRSLPDWHDDGRESGYFSGRYGPSEATWREHREYAREVADALGWGERELVRHLAAVDATARVDAMLAA